MTEDVCAGTPGGGARAKYLTRGSDGARAAVTLTVRELEYVVADAVQLALERAASLLVDRRGLAQRLGCSPSHIDALRKKGLPTVMVGEAVRFDAADVVAWLKASGTRAA